MILIDKPFASDFLIKTIKENNYPIIATETTLNNNEELNQILTFDLTKYIKLKSNTAYNLNERN